MYLFPDVTKLSSAFQGELMLLLAQIHVPIIALNVSTVRLLKITISNGQSKVNVKLKYLYT